VPIGSDAKWIGGTIAGLVVLLALLGREQVVDLRDAVATQTNDYQSQIEDQFADAVATLHRANTDVRLQHERELQALIVQQSVAHERILERAKIYTDQNREGRFTTNMFTREMKSRDQASDRQLDALHTLQDAYTRLDVLTSEYRDWVRKLADKSQVSSDLAKGVANQITDIGRAIAELKKAAAGFDVLQRDVRERLKQLEYQIKQALAVHPGRSATAPIDRRDNSRGGPQ